MYKLCEDNCAAVGGICMAYVTGRGARCREADTVKAARRSAEIAAARHVSRYAAYNRGNSYRANQPSL